MITATLQRVREKKNRSERKPGNGEKKRDEIEPKSGSTADE